VGEVQVAEVVQAEVVDLVATEVNSCQLQLLLESLLQLQPLARLVPAVEIVRVASVAVQAVSLQAGVEGDLVGG